MKKWLKNNIFRTFNISFSKSGDDIQLMKLINQSSPGTYVDIGSWHPMKASNTYYFYLRNWKGICVDPNPELRELYRRIRPKDTFVNCAVGSGQLNLKYYMLEDGYSSMNSLDLEFIQRHGLEEKIKSQIEVPTLSLESILDKNMEKGARLDFFDIDVEGFDLEVLKTNNWEKYRPKIVVIETDSPLKQDLTSEIVQYLEQQNYRLVGKSIINGDLGNLFLVAN